MLCAERSRLPAADVNTSRPTKAIVRTAYATAVETNVQQLQIFAQRFLKEP